MKIVIKESDKYTSDIHDDKSMMEYLIYVMLDDNTPLGCEQVVGEQEKELVLRSILSNMHHQGDITITKEDNLESLTEQYVDYVKFEDFKQAIIDDKPTYNG